MSAAGSIPALTDRGITKGIEYGIAAARAAGVPVEFRTLQAAE